MSKYNLLSNLRWPFGQKISKPTQENNEFWFAFYNLAGLGQVRYYDNNPETYISKGYAINPHVYSTINRIIQPLSMVPFEVFEVVDEKNFKQSLALKKQGQDLIGEVYRKKGLQPLEGDTANLNKIFKQPNECQNWTQFVQENVGFKLLLGNSFTYGLEPVGMEIEPGSGMERVFTKLYNLPAQFVEIITGNWTQPVAAYKLLTNTSITFNVEKVLHRKYWNPNYSAEGSFSFAGTVSGISTGGGGDNYYGLSPLSPLCNVVKRSNDSYTASMRMLENGIPAGIVSSNGKALNDKERKNLEQQYMQRFGGASNKNKLLFASQELKWQALGMNSVDMQLLDSNKADLEDIARVYRVPLPLLMNEASTMDNVRTSTVSLWHDAIIPELEELKSALNMFLVPGWERMTGKKLHIEYDLSNIKALQKNLTEQSDRLLSELQLGIWTIGEVREALGGSLEDQEELLTQRILSNGVTLLNNNNEQNEETSL